MLIFVVDLGHFKIYRVIQSEIESTRIELVNAVDSIEAHGRMSDKVSDSAGRFGSDSSRKTRKGYGEPHNIEIEKRRRIIKQVSVEIEKVLKNEAPKRWYLAAEKSINKQILKNLSLNANNILESNIVADLTKTPKSKLLNRFGII